MSSKKRSIEVIEYLNKFRVAPEFTSGIVSDYLESLDCPRSLAVAMLFRNGEHAQIAELTCDPLHYRNIEDFGDAYAATLFLSKYKDFTLGYDLDEVALKKFDKFELQCRLTNTRLGNLSADPLFRGPVVWLHSAVIRKIETILGEFHPEVMFETANWGPGATTLLKAREASSANKFQREVGITRDLYALLPDNVLADAYPAWHAHLLESGFPCFQVGNKVVTVPKDATANRVIAIEPGINLWFQLAIGKMIQRRLSRIGVDLRFQGRNQTYAKIGSKDRVLATVDFSSASDSISIETVRALLPPRWFSILDSCRSRFGQQGETLREWSKFSSMGNGFTFPLESLLFYAIAISVVEYLHDSPLSARENAVSVYGDDVIIPVKCLELFSNMCGFYGLTVNQKKTWSDSFFRESCGAHYMFGVDLKPIYLKDKLSDAQSIYQLANAVRRYAHRRMFKYGCDARFRTVFERLLESVPKPLRLRIPETAGDGGFIMNFDESTPRRARDSVEGYYFEHITDMAKRYESEEVGVLFTRLWEAGEAPWLCLPRRLNVFVLCGGVNAFSLRVDISEGSSQEERNNVPLRGRTRPRLNRYGLVQQWYDLGPWL